MIAALAALAGLVVGAGLAWLLGVRAADARLAALRRGLTALRAGDAVPEELADLASRLAEAAELQAMRARLKHLRHDIRGALSPAMLSADRLTMHPDEKVARAATAVMRSVERTTELLVDPLAPAAPKDPAAPAAPNDPLAPAAPKE